VQIAEGNDRASELWLENIGKKKHNTHSFRDNSIITKGFECGIYAFL
jgi:hypothetical protein